MVKERQRTTRKDKRGRILKKGEGQDRNGRYYFNYTDAYGKRRRIYNNDLIELRQEEANLLKYIEDGIDITALDRTLNEQFEIYIRTKNIKAATRTDYQDKWKKHVFDGLGRKKLVDIKKSDIQLFYKSLSEKGLKDGSIRAYANLLYPTFESAFNDDIIRKNPAKNCTKEYNRKSEKKAVLTVEQQEQLLDFIRNSARYNLYAPFITFALATACRLGEIIGLTWEDVDMKNRTISINHQLRYVKTGEGKGHGFINTTPKSEAGFRVIPMTIKCYRALVRQKELQLMLGINHDLEVAGLKNFVFTTTTGKPYDPTNVSNFIYNMVNAYNREEQKKAATEKREACLLPHISCHTLRHTACTRLAETNINIKVLQKFMGHSDINTTMNIYNHVDDTIMQSEIEKAERMHEAI